MLCSGTASGSGLAGLVEDHGGNWAVSWSSLASTWLVPRSPDKLNHDDYLSARRIEERKRLDVDPYSGKLRPATDATPESWQSFYPLLTAERVECFGRATNSEVIVTHEPHSEAAYVLFELFLLEHDIGPATYRWQPLLQSVVPRAELRAKLKLCLTKVKKKKGTPTQATAVFMMGSMDMLESFQPISQNYSSMFGIMRRSYQAKVRLSQPSPSAQHYLRSIDLSSNKNLVIDLENQSGPTTSLPHNIRPMALDHPMPIATGEDSVYVKNWTAIPQHTGPVLNTTRTLTNNEISLPYYCIRVAWYLGALHAGLGFFDVEPQVEAPLRYYSDARERMTLASRFTDEWKPVTKLLAGRAAARLESTIRKLLRTPARLLPTVYNFHGGGDDGEPGTIVVDDSDNVLELNSDPVTGRSKERHDNVAVLARWVHMQGIMSREDDYDTETIYQTVHRNTLIPYYEVFLHAIPTAEQNYRFWTFLDLEYTEYWFYFLQVANGAALYKMTLALQRLQVILQMVNPRNTELPNMNRPIRPEKHFWFKDIP